MYEKNERSVNLLAYSPITFPTTQPPNPPLGAGETPIINENRDFPVNRSVYTYTFETWMLLKPHLQYGMTNIEFQWTNHLKVAINLVQNSNKYSIECFPVYVDNTSETSQNSQSLFQNRGDYDNLNVIPEWYHYRCSVDLSNKKFLVHSIAAQNSNSNTKTNTPINIENSLSNCNSSDSNMCFDNLFTSKIFKFVASLDPLMMSSGRLFIRQVRLWDCYYCDYPGNNFRAEMNNTSLISKMFSNILRVWDVQGEDFSVDHQSTVVLKEYVNDINTLNFDAPLTVNENYFRFTYQERTDDNNINANYLVSLSDYYGKRFVPNLDVFPNEFQSVDSFPAPVSGRATLEFFMKIENVSNFNDGANIVLTDTMTVHLKSSQQRLNDDYRLQIYCFVDEFKDKVADSLGADAESKYCASENRVRVDLSNDKITPWFNVRCAFDQVQSTYYLSYNWDQTISSNYVNPLIYRDVDSETQNSITVRNNQPFRRVINSDTMMNLRVVYDKARAPGLHIKNVVYYNNYLPATVNYMYYDMYKLPFAHIPNRQYAVDFSRHDIFRNWVETQIGDQTKTNQFLYVNTYNYDLTVSPWCPDMSEYVNGKCQFFEATSCSTSAGSMYTHCRAPNKALTCATGFYLNQFMDCTSDCNSNTGSSTPTVRHPLTNIGQNGDFCNYTCDNSKNSFEESYALSHCVSNSNSNPSTKYPGSYSNYTCNNSDRFNDKFRYNFKCYPEEEATKGRLYFNSCYDFDNMTANLDDSASAVPTYSFGFWFKYDLVNYDCDWNTDLTSADIRYLLYSNSHKLSVSDDKTKVKYQLGDIAEAESVQDILEINPYSWNQLTFYIENHDTIYDTRVFVNFKDRTTLIPFKLDREDSVQRSKELVPKGSLLLNLLKIGFCNKPGCLEVGDDIKMASAFLSIKTSSIVRE